MFQDGEAVDYVSPTPRRDLRLRTDGGRHCPRRACLHDREFPAASLTRFSHSLMTKLHATHVERALYLTSLLLENLAERLTTSVGTCHQQARSR